MSNREIGGTDINKRQKRRITSILTGFSGVSCLKRFHTNLYVYRSRQINLAITTFVYDFG